MRYTVAKLDRRWSYRQYFEHAVIFSNRMTNWRGPLHFDIVQQYFVGTYGWSAEIRQWVDIRRYIANPYMYTGPGAPPKMPACVNPYWSWTNGHEDLRIYVKSSQELTLFTLKYPVDQK